LIAVPLNDEEQIDLNMALDVIGQQGVHALWVEAGGTLVSALIKAHLLQAMLLYVAPNTLGETALSAFHLPQLFEHAIKVSWDVFQRESVCRIEF
jgi:diaminohydroxyphosphoribosylaminopyrimidine deaminase/5-amino-6-(5-phosphoribosylamino)uracil reductase